MNILTCDIDVLFKDCNKYQSYIDFDLKPIQSWQVVEWKTGRQDYEVDQRCLAFIKMLLERKCKKAASYIIDEHDEIIDILCEYGENHFVTNIDFHSDISYGNDDTELNIENWVKHGRNADLIRDYLWICQDSSEVSPYSPFNYKRSSYKDMDIDALPEFDVVVFCISHQFTPPTHWGLAQKLREYLCNEVQSEFVVCPPPTFDETQYDEYIGEEDGIVDTEAWYKFFDYYVLAEKIDDVIWLSLIHLGDKNKNIIYACSKIVSDILKNYRVGFNWTNGYRSEKLIERLISQHTVVCEILVGRKREVILEKESGING